jgi:hypothetical protein
MKLVIACCDVCQMQLVGMLEGNNCDLLTFNLLCCFVVGSLTSTFMPVRIAA